MPKPAMIPTATPPRRERIKPPAVPTKAVVPTKIVPHEIRRLMKSHGNNPRMQDAVIEFIIRSQRQVDPEVVTMLQISGFDVSLIPKIPLGRHTGF